MYVRKIKLGDDVLLIPDSAEALGLGTSAEKNYTDIVTSLSPDLVTSDGVYNALADKSDYEEGNWKPIFYEDLVNKITPDASIGKYWKIGKLVFIEAQIILPGSYPCKLIEGLPFEPEHSRPSSLYGLSIISGGFESVSYLNQIVGSGETVSVMNRKYTTDDIRYNQWYLLGFYPTLS